MNYVAVQLKLTSLILLFCTLSQAFNNSGTCERTGPDGFPTKFCCDFYEKTSIGCKACTVGFESVNGTPCVPCKKNTFGEKCWNWCSCLTSQRCDHINGCVEVLTTIELYQGYSTFTKSVTEIKSSDDTPRNEFKPILIYIVAAGFLTFVLTTVIMISRKRKRCIESIRTYRAPRIAHLQSENEENEQYSTIL